MPIFSARGGANSHVIDGIPIQNIDLTTHWNAPDSGVLTLKMDRVIKGPLSCGLVSFKADHARNTTSFSLSSDAQAQDWVSLRGHAQKVQRYFAGRDGFAAH